MERVLSMDVIKVVEGIVDEIVDVLVLIAEMEPILGFVVLVERVTSVKVLKVSEGIMDGIVDV